MAQNEPIYPPSIPYGSAIQISSDYDVVEFLFVDLEALPELTDIVKIGRFVVMRPYGKQLKSVIDKAQQEMLEVMVLIYIAPLNEVLVGKLFHYDNAVEGA